MVVTRSAEAFFCATFPSVSLSYISIPLEVIETLEENDTNLCDRHELPRDAPR